MSCNLETITYCITSYIDKTFKYPPSNQLQGALIIFKHICEISKYLLSKYSNMSAQTLKIQTNFHARMGNKWYGLCDGEGCQWAFDMLWNWKSMNEWGTTL